VARILIVENDRDTAQLLATRLHDYGHSVIGAPSGPLALKQVGLDFPIDIAVLDIDLGGMNGFELLSELRRHPELDNPRLPAVFLTGSTEPEVSVRAHELGATVLHKPFVSGQLQCAVLMALNQPVEIHR
jgi:DNA-binding response OmpR family regulator